METNKSLELARLIGRRLRESCGGQIDTELPVGIAGGLAALREIEMQLLPRDASDHSATDGGARTSGESA